MPYIYANVETLEGMNKVGSKDCVALVRYYAHAPHTSAWREGAGVRGNYATRKGTAIAIFVNSRYPNNPTGNHAALYLRQDATGIWVMDQWRDNNSKPRISSRLLRFKGRHADGSFPDPSNNGDAFSVIE